MIRTWHLETLFVAEVLMIVNVATHAPIAGWICAAAVLLSFGHAAIGDRLAAQQGHLAKPDVECYRKLVWYFVGKEILWVAYFLMIRSYSAIVGCVVFLLYPLWRKIYRCVKEKSDANS